MKQKIFCVLMIVLLAMFVAVSMGGCGSSGDDIPQDTAAGPNPDVTPTPEDNSTEDVSMTDVMDSDDIVQEIITRVSDDVSIFGFLGLAVYDIYSVNVSGDGQTYTQQLSLMAELRDEEIDDTPKLYDKDTLLKHYESGDMIVLDKPDLAFINRIRSELDKDAEDSSIIGESGSLEVYAMAKRTVDGLENTFTYVVPRMGDLLASSAESDTTTAEEHESTNTQDEGEPEDDTTNNQGEDTASKWSSVVEFQIDRWVRFIEWMINLNVTSERNATTATSYQFRTAADDDITRLSKAQTKTFDFSYSDKTVNGVTFKNGTKLPFTQNRSNMVSYTIFSAHSFTSGKDYYLVQTTTTTVPKNFVDTYVEPWGGKSYKFNYLYGYTRQIGLDSWIDNGTMSVNDVALVKNAPTNINRETNNTEGMSWNVGGSVGTSNGKALATVNAGVSYTSSKSWKTTEYSIINNSMSTYPASARWYADVETPREGSGHFVGLAPYRKYWGVNATPASTQQLQYDSEWVWEVGSDYWRNHSNIYLKLKYWSRDGCTTGESDCGFSTYSKYDTWYGWTFSRSFVLTQPPHTAVDKSTFTFTANGASSQTFTLLAEDSWSMSGVPEWVKFTETSGSATGSVEKLLLFDVQANSTSSPRSATINIKSGRDTIQLQIAQTGI